ncbi:FtsB family cell division protein [Robertmurraya andreesenii]|uniref:Cell division protein DivIC n=1 Tax=Anoxybacillus andreesenii TaxID=1325932 RepID=A0ABT9V9T4_9BACL|nr:septum formation initiator family protein [Robertmurraya andreesenii]MDQ0157711.1 cell division protein DivIC [Robertmurraya andreesenii]
MSAIKNRSVTKIQSSYVKQHERHGMYVAKRKKLIIRRLMVFFLFAAATSYFMISALVSQASSLEEIKEEQKQLKTELKGLQKTETILKEEIVKLNDDEYIAKLARKDYFLSEQGEIIFNIPKEKEEKTAE